MKRMFIIYLFVIFAISSVYAQEWANDWIEKNHGITSKPDSMVALLLQEFQKAVGTPAPTFSFQRLDYDKIDSLVDYRGKVVLVNFWNTRCSGCRYEMPALGHLQDSLSEKRFQVIFLSPESKDILIQYFKDHMVSGTKGILIQNQLKHPFQMIAFPSSFVVDRNGIVRETWIGPLEFDSLVKRVLPYLAINNKY